MKKSILVNKSKNEIEESILIECPRCSGFGSTVQDYGGNCSICKGRGRCWVSESGWTLPLWGRIGSEKLY
jgi:DnaJ-class molecular chaperone